MAAVTRHQTAGPRLRAGTRESLRSHIHSGSTQQPPEGGLFGTDIGLGQENSRHQYAGSLASRCQQCPQHAHLVELLAAATQANDGVDADDYQRDTQYLLQADTLRQQQKSEGYRQHRRRRFRNQQCIALAHAVQRVKQRRVTDRDTHDAAAKQPQDSL